MKRILCNVLSVATILLWIVAGVALPASAAPSAQPPTVYQTPCDTSTCDPSSDAALDDGQTAKNTIQAVAKASSTAGLKWVRLQARYGSGDWICLHHWNTTASSFKDDYNWDTSSWPGSTGNPPGDCPSSSAYGDLTRNGSYELRVQATDALGTTASSPLAIKINNRPTVPVWNDDPSVDGESDRSPIVTLRWDSNPEPDIVEYHYVRTDPDGSQREYAVSATKPGGQGCETDGNGYICYDDDFPSSGFGGTYRYSLAAYRSSPSGSDPCAIGSGNCIGSPQTPDQSVSMQEPADPTSSPSKRSGSGHTTTGGGGGSSSTGSGSSSSSTPSASAPHTGGGANSDYKDFFTGSYEKQLPYDERRVLIPGGNGKLPVFAGGPRLGGGIDIDSEPSGRLWRSLAGGFLLMLVAAHMARLLRDTSATA